MLSRYNVYNANHLSLREWGWWECYFFSIQKINKVLKVHSKGDVNLCAASDLVCLKHTDAFSQRVDKVRSLRNVRSFVDRRLFWHTFSTGRSWKNISIRRNKSQRSPTARYALTLILSCAASGSRSVWSVGCPRSQRCFRLSSPSVPPHNKEKALPEHFLPFSQ